MSENWKSVGAAAYGVIAPTIVFRFPTVAAWALGIVLIVGIIACFTTPPHLRRSAEPT